MSARFLRSVDACEIVTLALQVLHHCFRAFGWILQSFFFFFSVSYSPISFFLFLVQVRTTQAFSTPGDDNPRGIVSTEKLRNSEQHHLQSFLMGLTADESSCVCEREREKEGERGEGSLYGTIKVTNKCQSVVRHKSLSLPVTSARQQSFPFFFLFWETLH